MTTMDTNLNVRTFIAMKLANSARKKRERSEYATSASKVMQSFVRLMLHLCGFGCLTFAGFTWNMAAGLVIAGVSCFALSWLSAETSDVPEPEVRHAPDLRTGR